MFIPHSFCVNIFFGYTFCANIVILLKNENECSNYFGMVSYNFAASAALGIYYGDCPNYGDRF